MKKLLLFVLLTSSIPALAQITTPVIKAGFGVDGELRTNYYNNFVQSGNDDWFNNGTNGTGQPVIDTTGAAAIVARYAIDPNFRKLPFYRTMRVPQYSLVNNRLWIDAVYIRDYNGNAGGDSTAFTMSNKNGDSPQNWSAGVTSVLDKNDISDMMIHVRRAGPNKTDSLWFIGGISLHGTTGNRYFDFELYQTDIFYTRSTGQFTNYGPDAGHTSWKFDASGNIIAPGDVIFTAEYSSSSLTAIEARIWVNRSDLGITPVGFNWTGTFDGASNGAEYGYAGITPNSAGTYYTGLQSGNGTWAGPFGFIDGGNNLVTNYTARQFMEFSVNLTKLGLDPITLLGGSACGLPFRRILVKTRSSTSFTSELKDFIGPFDFFSAPPVEAAADVPMYCGSIGVSELFVTNPASASVYTWTTVDGHIVTSNVGPSITVDAPGTYIVTQQLLDGCSSFAMDTIVITYDASCVPMDASDVTLSGALRQAQAQLRWTARANALAAGFELQRSTDGQHFETVQSIAPQEAESNDVQYAAIDGVQTLQSPFVYYRLRVKTVNNTVVYSNVVRLHLPPASAALLLFPNPVGSTLQVLAPVKGREDVTITIYDIAGALVRQEKRSAIEGEVLQVEATAWKAGSYMAHVVTRSGSFWKKFVVNRSAYNK